VVIAGHVTKMRSHHSIQHSENPHDVRKFTALFYRTEVLLPTEVLYCGIKGNFLIFCCCDLDLDAMTFMWTRRASLWRYSADQNELSTSIGFRKLSYYIHTYRQTDNDIQTYILPQELTSRSFTGDNKLS